MPSLRSLLLLALPLASAGVAHASDFQDLVNDVPSESLRAALEKLIEICAEDLPLTRAKTETMLSTFKTHGFVSYF